MSERQDSAIHRENVAFLKSTSRTGVLLTILFAVLGYKGSVGVALAAAIGGISAGIAIMAYGWYRYESSRMGEKHV